MTETVRLELIGAVVQDVWRARPVLRLCRRPEVDGFSWVAEVEVPGVLSGPERQPPPRYLQQGFGPTAADAVSSLAGMVRDTLNGLDPLFSAEVSGG
jgi:hypothetical protein